MKVTYPDAQKLGILIKSTTKHLGKEVHTKDWDNELRHIW